MKIQMVDLKGQYNKIKHEIDSAIQNVIDSTTFIKGPQVSEFASSLESYLNVNTVIPCGNGTDALQIALMALDLKPGDEVVTSNFTFAATAEVIALLQLKPVLVDVYPDTFNINIEEIEKAITSKTKAIIPVHLFGQCADMEPILAIAKKHSLYLIEDSAQAIGANYTFSDGSIKKAGTIGDIGTTSFFPSKNLGCYGDGGAIFTNNEELGNRIKAITNHGMYRRYYHDEIGVNSRLDSIQAAILNIKLPHLNNYSKARYNTALYYNNAFKNISGITSPIISEFSNHVFHQYTLKLDENLDRSTIQSELKSEGIPSMIYYPVPLHLQKAYQDKRYTKGSFPVTEKLCNTVLSLPMHTELSETELDHITKTLIKYINKK